MPYQNHARATARFELGPGSSNLEQASCTLNFPDLLVLNATHTQRVGMAEFCFEKWASFIQNSAARFPEHVRLMEVRYYVIGTNGRADHPPAISTQAPVRGSTTGNIHPYQVSNVLSLVASPGGKGRFGRIYLPPQVYTMGDNGEIGYDHLSSMAPAAFGFLNSISDKPGIDGTWKLCIAGRTGAEGTLREVEEVRFGKVPDTQRRRRRNLDEAYVIADFDA